MRPRDAVRTTAFALVIIAVATALVYAGSFRGTWISDDTRILEDQSLHALTWENVRQILVSRTDGVNYIPVNFLSLALDRAIFGLNPWGFHLTNLLLHVANAFAVYFLLLRFHESRGIATAAALLWSIHPVQVESVAWISERKNLLSTLFFLLAFRSYLRFTERPNLLGYAAVLVCYVLALLSKVNTIVLPALLLWHELTAKRRLRSIDVARTIPLFACGLLVAWLNLHDNPSHGAAYHGGDFATTMRTSATTIPRYLANVLAPFALMSYYPVPLRGSWMEPTVAGSAALVGVGIVLILWCTRRGQPEGFWLAWFAATLAPMLNIVPFPALMNDRYLYLPLLGALVPLLRMGRRLLPVAAAPWTVAIVAVVLGVLTTRRVPVFRDELSLWADIGLRTSYITADAPFGGLSRTQEKRLLTEAVARHPDQAWLHNNIGGIAFEENRLADALPALERAHALDPHDPVIALNLGRTYLRTGRLDDAERILGLAVALEPPSFWAHLNLARVHLLKRDLPAARRELAVAKTLKSDPYFWQGFEQALTRAERQRS